MSQLKAIPRNTCDVFDATIPIQDNREDLIEMNAGERVFLSPQYHIRGFHTATQKIMLRRGAGLALKKAASRLPVGINFLLWDGFRSLETQQEIIERFANELESFPEKTKQTLLNTYVSPIPKRDAEYRLAPPPHTTGGAIDLTLCDNDGKAFNLGAGFDDFGAHAAIDHFETEPTEENHNDTSIRYFRRLLYLVMTTEGFAPYPHEFWHFEFQTQRAAAFNGQGTALYGAVAKWKGNHK